MASQLSQCYLLANPFPCWFEIPALSYIKGSHSLYLGDLDFVPSSVTNFFVIFTKPHPKGFTPV